MEEASEIQRLIMRQLEAEMSGIAASQGKRARRTKGNAGPMAKIGDGAPPKLSRYLATLLATLTVLPRPFHH